MKSVDVLVAVRNEERSIPLFVEEFKRLSHNDIKINIIFLEDGSTDGTIEILRDFAKKNENVDYISLKNKYGQYAALTFGLLHSHSDAAITMDVDGGHPVETAVKMINSFVKGADIVQGQRIVYKRKKIYRTILSYAYNLFFYLIVGVNFFKQNVMFRLMDKSVKEKFLRNKNWWHIFKTNFRDKDMIKIDYITYSAPEREFGESKYGFFRLLKLSYKSFFSMLSLQRLIVINVLSLALTLLSILNDFIILFIIGMLILLIINISHYKIVNHYPIGLLKVLETSIKGIKK